MQSTSQATKHHLCQNKSKDPSLTSRHLDIAVEVATEMAEDARETIKLEQPPTLSPDLSHIGRRR